jgi:hypothetical protein
LFKKKSLVLSKIIGLYVMEGGRGAIQANKKLRLQ